MNLHSVSRRRLQTANDMMGIGFVVLNRGPRDTYRSLRHFPRNKFKAKVEYERMGPVMVRTYRCGFHIFKSLEDARAACELGVNVICKVSYRTVLAYGHVKLGGVINLRTGDTTKEWKAPVVVTRYRMIIEEVE